MLGFFAVLYEEQGCIGVRHCEEDPLQAGRRSNLIVKKRFLIVRLLHPACSGIRNDVPLSSLFFVMTISYGLHASQ